MEPETKAENDLSAAVSAADIARTLERTPTGVRKAIKRLGIKAIGTVGTISIYPASTTGKVGAAMRKRNLTA